MPTKQVLFEFFACIYLASARAEATVDPRLFACDGKSENKPCKVTLAGVEVDGICEIAGWGVGKYLCSNCKKIRADDSCLQAVLICEVSRVSLEIP
jgi:hypothetical protein